MRGLNAVGWLAVVHGIAPALRGGAMVILLASNVGACAGSDAEVAAQFAEECSGECDEGLICSNRVCTAQCAGMVDCTPFHPTAICDNGYCFVPCTTSFNCPNGLACTQLQQSTNMTCRAQP